MSAFDLHGYLRAAGNRNLELLRPAQFVAEVLYCDKQSESGRAYYGGGPNLFPR